MTSEFSNLMVLWQVKIKKILEALFYLISVNNQMYYPN